MKSLIRLRALFIVVVKVPAFLLLLFSLAQAQQPAWRLAAGTQSLGIVEIDVFRRNPDTVYANSLLGLLLSTDRGEHWDSVNTTTAPGLGALKVDPFNSQIVWAWRAIPFGDGLGVTTDGGHTWRGVLESRIAATVVEIDPIDPRTVYAGSGSRFIRRTTDLGQTWELLTTPPGNIRSSFAIAPTNNNIFYIGYSDPRAVFKSTDRGASWIPLPLGVSAGSGVKLAVDPYNADLVYAALYGYGVYKSSDGGATWHEINNGLTRDDWAGVAIAINPKNPKEIFLGTSSVYRRMFFRTTNGGNRWESFADGLPVSGSVGSIAIDTLNNRLLSAVGSFNGSGVYILDRTTAINNPPETPDIFSLYPNYPNPFNSQTVIQFSLASRATVELKVYSLLGREVKTLLSEVRDKGTHTAVFSAENLPSGVYFYRLKTPTFSQTQRMVLIK